MEEEPAFQIFEVSIFLYGKDLDPEKINSILGVTATRSHRSGDVRPISSGFTKPAKTGLWMLRSSLMSYDINDHIRHLISVTRLKSPQRRALDAVEIIRFDVFVAKGDKANECVLELLLTSESIKMIAELGARLEITV